jgi:hypothetical protein
MPAQPWESVGNTVTGREFLGTNNNAPLVIKTAGTEKVRIDPAGHVGIGSPNPQYDLHLGDGKTVRIEGGPGLTGFSFGGNGTFGIDAPGIRNGRFVVQDGGNVGIGSPNPQYDLHLGAGKAVRIEGGPGLTGFSFGSNGTFAIDAPGIPNGRFVVQDGGNVGIGMPNPQYNLHLGIGALRIEGGPGLTGFSFGGNGTFGIDAPEIPNGRFVVQDGGNVGIGTSAPKSTLHVKGDVTVTGDILLTDAADCAEHFDVIGPQLPEPGTVVVIDEAGALRESKEAYDKKVAGVVSGAGEYTHALVLDKRSSREHHVALALVGKVYCKVDARYSPIEVGDLLTTSATPGHAMKAAEPVKAFGSVIGKALRSLNGGQGLIPILISLQ